MNNVRFMYIRDANFQPIGCVAIALNRSKNRAEFGLSMCNPKDAMDTHGRKVRFNRETARTLATVDLDKNAKRVYAPSDASMHQVTQEVMKGIISNGYAPSRAVKFAKQWLKLSHMIWAGGGMQTSCQ